MDTTNVDAFAHINYVNVDCAAAPTENTFIGSGDITLHSDVASIALGLNATYNKCARTWFLTANSVSGQQWLVEDIAISDVAASLIESSVCCTKINSQKNTKYNV